MRHGSIDLTMQYYIDREDLGTREVLELLPDLSLEYARQYTRKAAPKNREDGNHGHSAGVIGGHRGG